MKMTNIYVKKSCIFPFYYILNNHDKTILFIGVTIEMNV